MYAKANCHPKITVVIFNRQISVRVLNKISAESFHFTPLSTLVTEQTESENGKIVSPSTLQSKLSQFSSFFSSFFSISFIFSLHPACSCLMAQEVGLNMWQSRCDHLQYFSKLIRWYVAENVSKCFKHGSINRFPPFAPHK